MSFIYALKIYNLYLTKPAKTSISPNVQVPLYSSKQRYITHWNAALLNRHKEQILLLARYTI